MLHENAVALAESTANAPATGTFEGKWRNQMASTMELHVSGKDVIGTYTSPNSGLPGGGSVTGALKGWTAGDLISFTVIWPGGSITAWTGQLVNEGGQKLRTLWHLVTDVADAQEPTRLWTSTMAGADEFKRV